jgi:hypothetical protein
MITTAMAKFVADIRSNVSEAYSGLKATFLAQFLWLATIIIVVAAAIVYWLSPTAEVAGQSGDFVAGFSAALAFLWLIAGFRLQSKEIKLQRKELRLQRKALQNQAKELKNAAKFASLNQIASLLAKFDERISSSGVEISHASGLINAWTTGMSHWKQMFESHDIELVHRRYLDWMKIEGVTRSYLSTIATAMKLYIEHHSTMQFDPNKPDEEFILIYQPLVSKAPYLSEHFGTAYMMANFVFMYAPGLKVIQLAGLTASSKLLGASIFKQDALKKIKEEVLASNCTLPAVALD